MLALNNSPISLKLPYHSNLRMRRLDSLIKKKISCSNTLEDYEFLLEKEKKKISREIYITQLEELSGNYKRKIIT